MNDHQSTAEHFNIAGELGSSMCANCIHTPAQDQQWQTRLAVDGEHAGKVDHKMEFAGFRINVRWSVMCIRTTNIRLHVMDVHEANHQFLALV